MCHLGRPGMSIVRRFASSRGFGKSSVVLIARFGNPKFSSSYEETVLPDFRDGLTAYEMKTSGSMMRSLVVLKLCSIDLLVDNHKKVTDHDCVQICYLNSTFTLIYSGVGALSPVSLSFITDGTRQRTK